MSTLMLLLQPPKCLTVAPPEPPPKPRGGNPHPDHMKANMAKVDKARKRIKRVMGDEWVSTPKIDSRLGTSRSSTLATLRSFEARGELACRPLRGEPYARNKGYEWKWIK
jgi:hypothetical protein